MVFKGYFQKFYAMLRKRGKRPEDAEDLVQDAFVRLLTYIEDGKKVLEPEAFLATAVFNLSVDRVRRDRAHLYVNRAVEELPLLDLSPDPQERAASQQCLQRTRTILDTALGERARKIF